MMKPSVKIVKELTALKDTSGVSEQVLIWAHRVEVHRVQKGVVDNIRDVKDFD